MVFKLFVMPWGCAMTMTLDSPVTLETPKVPDLGDAKKVTNPLGFVQFVRPTQFPKIQIPDTAQHLILGIPGFLCTSAALKDAKEKLNNGTICYVDWGSVLNLGFTKPTTTYVADFADYLAQTFGNQIAVHGNSLGGFLAFRVAQTHPDIVNRLYLTASPHALSMNPVDLQEHTNIAAFLSVMKSRVFGRFYDQELMKTWEDFVSNAVTEAIVEFNEILGRIDIATFAATNDTTVNGKKCLFPLSERRRNFAVEGDHVDVVRGAIPVIEYLEGRDLQAELPDQIQAGLRPIEDIHDLVKKSGFDVAANFVISSIPTSITSAIGRTVNAPVGLIGKVLGRPNQPLPEISLDGALTLEPPVLSLVRAS